MISTSLFVKVESASTLKKSEKEVTGFTSRATINCHLEVFIEQMKCS